MRQIVLLTDFSDNSWSALEYAVQFFKEETVTFHLLHIKDMRGFMSDDLIGANVQEGVHEALLGESKRQLQFIEDKAEKLYKNSKHQFKSVCLFGAFYQMVSEYCDKEKIDQVVLGTTGATGAKQVFIGSTAAKVINKMNIPVLAIPNGYKFREIDQILFPVDYKVDFLPITLLPILKLLDSSKAKLSLLYVNEKKRDLSTEQWLNKKEIEHIFEGYTYSLHTVTGMDVDSVLGCLSEFLDTDMTIMIKKKKSFVESLFSGTHIRKVSYHITRPLFVLPEHQVLHD